VGRGRPPQKVRNSMGEESDQGQCSEADIYHGGKNGGRGNSQKTKKDAAKTGRIGKRLGVKARAKALRPFAVKNKTLMIEKKKRQSATRKVKEHVEGHRVLPRKTKNAKP